MLYLNKSTKFWQTQIDLNMQYMVSDTIDFLCCFFLQVKASVGKLYFMNWYTEMGVVFMETRIW